MSPQCTVCFRPVDGVFLCVSCLGAVLADLRQVAELEVELETTRSRQDRIGDTTGARSAEIPLPWREKASEAEWVLRNTLSTWARDLHDTNTAAAEPIACADTIADMAAWLLRHPSWIAGHPAADELADEIGSAIGNARRVIDRPPEMAYAGPCGTDGCDADLYGWPDAAEVTCRDCGAVHDLPARREWLLGQARNQLATAPEIARALPTLLGKPISVHTIRIWAHRGRLAPHGSDRGRPLYRIGEVLALALAHEATVRSPRAP